MHNIIRRASTATITFTAAGLMLAGPAYAQVEPAIRDIGNGTLLAKGAAVSIPIQFICEQGLFYNVNLNLNQKVSKGQVAAGSNQVNGTCSGQVQSATLTIRPDTRDGNARAFKKGTALAEDWVGRPRLRRRSRVGKVLVVLAVVGAVAALVTRGDR